MNLEADWSRFVTEDGRQLQTVGHHWSLSRPMNDSERNNTDRNGVCLACHQEIPNESTAVSLLHHVAKAGNLLPRTDDEHVALIRKNILFAAWGQVSGGFLAVIGVLLAAVLLWKRRRGGRAKTAGEGQSTPVAKGDDIGDTA